MFLENSDSDISFIKIWGIVKLLENVPNVLYFKTSCISWSLEEIKSLMDEIDLKNYDISEEYIPSIQTL